MDDGYRTMPAELVIIRSGLRSEAELVLHEGKFHQVRRMFEAVGKKVLYLKRLQIGSSNWTKHWSRANAANSPLRKSNNSGEGQFSTFKGDGSHTFDFSEGSGRNSFHHPNLKRLKKVNWEALVLNFRGRFSRFRQK